MGGRILFCVSDATYRCFADGLYWSSFGDVSWIRSGQELTACARDFCNRLIVIEEASPLFQQALTIDTPKLVLLHHKFHHEILMLAAQHNITDFIAPIGEGSIYDVDELLSALRLQTAADTDEVGSWGRSQDCPVYRFRLHEAKRRDELLVGLETNLASLGWRPRRCKPILNVVDELLTNAMYNAPHDGERFLHSQTNRRDKIELDPERAVEIAYAIGGEELRLSVCDQYGSLGLDRLYGALIRAARTQGEHEDKAGGAGLGLYMILSTAHHVSFHIEPWKFTRATVTFRREGPRFGGASLSIAYAGPPEWKVWTPIEHQMFSPSRIRASMSDDVNWGERTLPMWGEMLLHHP